MGRLSDKCSAVNLFRVLCRISVLASKEMDKWVFISQGQILRVLGVDFWTTSTGRIMQHPKVYLLEDRDIHEKRKRRTRKCESVHERMTFQYLLYIQTPPLLDGSASIKVLVVSPPGHPLQPRNIWATVQPPVSTPCTVIYYTDTSQFPSTRSRQTAEI